MKKMLSIILILVCFYTITNVNASNVTNEIFDQALETEELISGELLDYAIKEGRMLGSDEYYSEIITNYNGYTGQIIGVFEREITKEELNNYHSIQSLASCGSNCYETNAKKFTANIFTTQYISVYKIQLYNVWKTVPKIKSYDTIAARWDVSDGLGLNSENTSVYGEQRYCINSDCNVVYYNNDSSNTKIESNGAGVSMNIVDSATSGIENLLNINVYTYNSGILHIYATYQHATSNISLTTAKSYSFGNGLGGTLVYPSSIVGYFDAMQGLNINAHLPL